MLTWARVGLAGLVVSLLFFNNAHAVYRVGETHTGYAKQIIVKIKASATVTAVVQPLTGGPKRLSADTMSALSVAAGVTMTYMRAMSGEAYVVSLPSYQPLYEVRAICDRIETMPEVEYAEPDVRMFPLTHSSPPDDPNYLNDNQWYLLDEVHVSGGVNVTTAWDTTTGSSTPVIAVLDTGILDTHADLGNIDKNLGYDFITDTNTANDSDGRDTDPADPGDWIDQTDIDSGDFPSCDTTSGSSWHGSRVASIIGADTNNAVGIAGINHAAKIIPVRVLGKCGGTTSDIADAIRWAAGLSVSGVPDNANPAKIINLSLGADTYDTCDTTSQAAIDDARNAGAIIVVSAGNSAINVSNTSPANCAGVVAVAATGRSGEMASYTNFGSGISLSAPGGNGSDFMYTAADTSAAAPAGDTYDGVRGTSFSAPVVAGVASLIWNVDPTLHRLQVEHILRESARSFPSGSGCTIALCGEGIVDAAAAVSLAQTFTPTVDKLGIGKDGSGALGPVILLFLLFTLALRSYYYGNR